MSSSILLANEWSPYEIENNRILQLLHSNKTGRVSRGIVKENIGRVFHDDINKNKIDKQKNSFIKQNDLNIEMNSSIATVSTTVQTTDQTTTTTTTSPDKKKIENDKIIMPYVSTVNNTNNTISNDKNNNDSSITNIHKKQSIKTTKSNCADSEYNSSITSKDAITEKDLQTALMECKIQSKKQLLLEKQILDKVHEKQAFEKQQYNYNKQRSSSSKNSNTKNDRLHILLKVSKHRIYINDP
jgi:hypothetical protein